MQNYELVYADNEIIVVNKAPNFPCHPLVGSEQVTLIDAVALEFPEVQKQFAGDREGGLCHRIDNGTSGLVVIARYPAIRQKYRTLFQDGKIEKSYLALVKGRVAPTFEVSLNIAHHQKNSRKMVALTSPSIRYRSQPQEARTMGKTLLANDEASLVRVWIGAGRRHQIRVHLASLGHPLFGDQLYGGPEARHIRGHALHASTILLPDGNKLEAPCPAEWENELSHRSLIKVSPSEVLL